MIEGEMDWLEGLSDVADEKWTEVEKSELSSKDKLRRGEDESFIQEEATISFLRDDEGVIRIDAPEDTNNTFLRGRRGLGGSSNADNIVGTLNFPALPPSDVYTALERVDDKLTPEASTAAFEASVGAIRSGLREFSSDSGRLRRIDRPRKTGKILLLIHGTFSNNDTTVKQMRETRDGRNFLVAAQDAYDQIVTYDHRTLGVSPILNARELALLFSESEASIDIICHSRGGLVSRWFVEAFDRKPDRAKRVIFVASPLAGTGLASPHNVRQTMELLANILSAFGKAPKILPFQEIFSLLARISGFFLKGVASTPIADATIALIPGLDSMSRVGNNHEILLAQQHVFPDFNRNYYAITSNFEPDKVSPWRFWRAFRNIGDRVKDFGADKLFDGPNDLVVDTSSMSFLGQRNGRDVNILKKNTLDFGTNGVVHHTNYFEQARVYEAMSKWLMS